MLQQIHMHWTEPMLGTRTGADYKNKRVARPRKRSGAKCLRTAKEGPGPASYQKFHSAMTTSFIEL